MAGWSGAWGGAWSPAPTGPAPGEPGGAGLIGGWSAGWNVQWPVLWGTGEFEPGEAVPAWPPLVGLRNSRFMVHRSDVYQPEYPFVGGDPGATNWEWIWREVPCHFRTKSAVDVATEIGLQESSDLITIDEVRLPEGFPLETSHLIINRTLLPSGEPADAYGTCYVVRGAPKQRATAPTRRAGRVIGFLTRLEVVPPGVEV